MGYGLEGAIPDVIAHSIIKNDIKPAFKQGNYLGGIHAAVNDLSKAAAGEYHNAREKGSGNDSGGLWALIPIIIIIIIIIAAKNNNGGGGYRRRSNADWILPVLFNSGGWNSGGSGWSGDSGGGGFGGFGGGSSGGGGASGGW